MAGVISLKSVHVTEYKSVRDSGEFAIDPEITCLVGKNESGKTALLQAVYKLNPIVSEHADYDVVDEYPRADVEDYQQSIDDGKEHARVISAVFEMPEEMTKRIEEAFGEGVMPEATFELSKKYDNERYVGLEVDEAVACKSLIEDAKLPDELLNEAIECKDLATLADVLHSYVETKEALVNAATAEAEPIEDEAKKKSALIEAKKLGPPPQVAALLDDLNKIEEDRGLSLHIWARFAKPDLPAFLYFDEYYQLEGHLNIEKLKERQQNGSLFDSDRPMLGLIELARLDLDKLLNPRRTEELNAKLEGASNHLSKKVLKYWSQNKHLQVKFDSRQASPGDPVGMRDGTNLWGRVFDSVHAVSTPLGTRSKGFIWFFSFLAWFSQQRKHKRPLILLLDEPGLFLHAKAQWDLLNYMDVELAPHHQVLYTTHSPFLVHPEKFQRVRIVEDRSIDSDNELPFEQQGTKVLSEALEANDDSLFPLQGALGFDIAQTLFVGPNCLIVEGVSDLLYLQGITRILEEKGRTGLDSRWTITPVGGSDKVPTFVALLGAQKKLKLATLIDIAKRDKQTIENLYKRKLLKKKNVLTFADFTTRDESDIEDMFEEDFYLQLVNGEYSDNIANKISTADIQGKADRVLVRLEGFIEAKKPITGASFNHYRPARYFVENEATLKASIADATLDRFEAAFKAVNALL